MGWYARKNAEMMAKRQGVEIPPGVTPEEWRRQQTAERLGGVKDDYRAAQDQRDAAHGQRVDRKAERKSRRGGTLT